MHLKKWLISRKIILIPLAIFGCAFIFRLIYFLELQKIRSFTLLKSTPNAT